MDITATKLEIIKAIAELESEVLIKKILALLPNAKRDYVPTPEEDPLAVAREPIPDYITIESLKKEQDYSIKKMNEFFDKTDRSIWAGEDLMEVLNEI